MLLLSDSYRQLGIMNDWLYIPDDTITHTILSSPKTELVAFFHTNKGRAHIVANWSHLLLLPGCLQKPYIF